MLPQSFKNQFAALLLCLGVISRLQGGSAGSDRAPAAPRRVMESRRRDLEHILFQLQNTITISVAVVDPLLLTQMEHFLTAVEQSLERIQSKKPLDYEGMKTSITHLVKRLNEDQEFDGVLK